MADRGGGQRALVGAAAGVGAGLPLLALALPRISCPLTLLLVVHAIWCAEYWLGSWVLSGHGQTCDQPWNWAQCDYAGVAVACTVTSAAGFAAVGGTALALRRRQARRSGRVGG